MASLPVLASPPSLEGLLQGGPVAVFMDFDGTLVEIAPGPDAITPLPDLAVRLANLDQRMGGRAALVSGRALSDIEKHIGPVPIAGAGSHGSDIRLRDGSAVGEAPSGFPVSIRTALTQFASDNGLDYEDKPHGGALHYRASPEKGEEAEAFARQIAEQHGWKAQSGKCVVELVKGDADKGSAVRALMQQQPFAGSVPIFVGDDLTDEAGFAACQQLGGFGILVGERASTQAGYKLADVASVHHWLDL